MKSLFLLLLLAFGINGLAQETTVEFDYIGFYFEPISGDTINIKLQKEGNYIGLPPSAMGIPDPNYSIAILDVNTFILSVIGKSDEYPPRSVNIKSQFLKENKGSTTNAVNERVSYSKSEKFLEFNGEQFPMYVLNHSIEEETINVAVDESFNYDLSEFFSILIKLSGSKMDLELPKGLPIQFTSDKETEFYLIKLNQTPTTVTFSVDIEQ